MPSNYQVASVGLEPGAVLPSKKQKATEGGARGALSTSIDALAAWLNVCPMDLPVDVRLQIETLLRSAPDQKRTQ